MEMPTNIHPGIADTCNLFADITRCLDISEIILWHEKLNLCCENYNDRYH